MRYANALQLKNNLSSAPPSNFSFFLISKMTEFIFGKPKNIFIKILGRESMRWQSFVRAGLG
jgi:hypothetical protein